MTFRFKSCIRCTQSHHLQFESEQRGSDWGAVDGPVAPGGRQTHCVVTVHVGQEKQPGTWTFPHIPKVYGQRGVQDDFTIYGHGLCFHRTSNSDGERGESTTVAR